VIDRTPCFAFHPNTPASCSPILRLGPRTEKTHVGTYYPLFYVPLGVAARIAGSVPSAIYAERVVAALLCGLFLLIAFALTCTSAWSRAAWFFAAGPLTFYVASSGATNGIEVAASICLVSVGIELSQRQPRLWLWVVWTISGVSLASAKSLGPLFLVFDLVAVIVLTRPWSWWWDQFRRVPIALGLMALAAIANGLWSLAYLRSPNASPTIPYSHYLRETLTTGLRKDAEGFFSVFGWIDVNTPAHLWLLGYVAAVILIGSALIKMVPSARWKFLAIFVAAGLITLVVTVTERAGGYVFQARYTLAIIAPLGLLAVVARPKDDGASALPRVCIALMIILNAAALYGNAQRYAVGERGSIFFLFHAEWSPPGGWLLTTLLALVGLVCLGTAGLLSTQTNPRSQESPLVHV
jgi:MFS family permease